MRIHTENTVAMVIDYQEKLVPAMSAKESLLKKSAILLSGLRALGIPMIVTTQYAKGLGDTVPQICEAIGKEAVIIDKNTFSALENDEVKQALPATTKNIIVCGMEAHICVLQTVIDLQEAGYQTFLPADCIASRDETDKAFSLVRAEQEGAKITTAEAMLYELLQSSKHPAFKTISGLVK